MKNYYLILGVPRDESRAGIRRAYRRAAKESHPDAVGPGDTAKHKNLTTAYETLMNPVERAVHDKALAEADADEHAVEPDPAMRRTARTQGREHMAPEHGCLSKTSA